MRHTTKMLIKHEAKLIALLVLRPHAKCFISHKAWTRQCFYYFKEFPEKCFIKMCSLVHCNLNGVSSFIFVSYNYMQAYMSWYFLIAKLASYTRSCSLSFINSLFVQSAMKNGKLKHSSMELFTVSGMLKHSKWCCL